LFSLAVVTFFGYDRLNIFDVIKRTGVQAMSDHSGVSLDMIYTKIKFRHLTVFFCRLGIALDMLPADWLLSIHLVFEVVPILVGFLKKQNKRGCTR
jgi:hypothetical protein